MSLRSKLRPTWADAYHLPAAVLFCVVLPAYFDLVPGVDLGDTATLLTMLLLWVGSIASFCLGVGAAHSGFFLGRRREAAA